MTFENNDQLKPLILDIGSSLTRFGWAGNDFPDIVAPSVYVEITDYIFTSNVVEGLEDLFVNKENVEEYLFGIDALKYQNILNVREFKKEKNFNNFLKFFQYYYKQFNISPENQFKQPIIVLTPFFTTELEKVKLQDFFFNQLNFPKLLFLSESQAIISALQKENGVIINIGESNSYISAIFHGFTNIMAQDVFPIAGKDLTNYFLNMILTGVGSEKKLYLDKWFAKEVKEKVSLCVLNSDGENKRIKEGLRSYNQIVKLPDGTSLNVNSERFMLSEPLFNPRIIHVDYIGLPEAVAKMIKVWNRENWEELLPNIILSGGSCLIPGLKDRLKSELTNHFSDKLKDKINVITVSGLENMSWIGASVLYTKNQLIKGWIDNPSSTNINNNRE